jgi:hypothetical protein
MRLRHVETNEDFGRVTRITRRVSGRFKGQVQAITTDREMAVRLAPRMFVAFRNASRGTLESKFVHGTFRVVHDHTPRA